MKIENFSHRFFFYDFLTPSPPFGAVFAPEILPPASYRYPLDIRSVSARYPLQERKTYGEGIRYGSEIGGRQGGVMEFYSLIECWLASR